MKVQVSLMLHFQSMELSILKMAFMGVMDRKFKGSGLEDLAVAAGGIVEPGSVDQVLNGKHYKRDMCLQKLVYECLASLLISTAVE